MVDPGLEMKKCVYTINFGKYDQMREPFKTPGWDYIVFTNNKDIDFCGWEPRQVKFLYNLPNHLLARYVYINSHLFVPDYDYSLMIGGQIRPSGDLNEFAEQFMDFSQYFNMMKHPYRTSIYKEAEIILREHIDTPENVNPQMERYRNAGFPDNYGLSACGIIGRRNNKFVSEFNEMWWGEVSNGSYRDQLSFDFVRWTLAFPVPHYFDYSDTLHHGYFEIRQHGTGKLL